MKIRKSKIRDLKRKLDYHYKYFDRTKISPDPLEYPHRFTDPADIEISAFVSSVFAYGNIKQINSSLGKIHQIMNYSPLDFISSGNSKEFKRVFSGFVHRFYDGYDIASLFEGLKRVYENYGSLKYLFLLYHFDEEKNLKHSISFFSDNLLSLSSGGEPYSNGLKFMFPDPNKGSACKRMNLFLRWMVRRDELDFGLWKEISPSRLVIPVDTHIARICQSLRLTGRKNVSWHMAEEITENLKILDEDDPVKYDFAICHIGIRKMSFEPVI